MLAEANWAACLGSSGKMFQTHFGSSPPSLWVQLQNGTKAGASFHGASKVFGD